MPHFGYLSSTAKRSIWKTPNKTSKIAHAQVAKLKKYNGTRTKRGQSCLRIKINTVTIQINGSLTSGDFGS